MLFLVVFKLTFIRFIKGLLIHRHRLKVMPEEPKGQLLTPRQSMTVTTVSPAYSIGHGHRLFSGAFQMGKVPRPRAAMTTTLIRLCLHLLKHSENRQSPREKRLGLMLDPRSAFRPLQRYLVSRQILPWAAQLLLSLPHFQRLTTLTICWRNFLLSFRTVIHRGG